MAHTLSPWSTKYRMVKVFGQIDSGELAARLGSINTFDRRGNVFWMDDFEGVGKKWRYAYSFNAGSIALSAARSYRGSQSMKLTTYAGADEYAELQKMFPNPSDTSIGVEAALYQDNSSDYFGIHILGYNGTHRYTAGVKWDWSAQEVSYYDSAGNPVLLDSYADKNYVDEYWLPIKIVFDWSTLKYKRIIVGGIEYPLTTISMQAAESSQEPAVQIKIRQYTTAAAAKTGYVDNVILTQNEP